MELFRRAECIVAILPTRDALGPEFRVLAVRRFP